MFKSHASDYSSHPLSWERTDRGRALTRLAGILIALLVVGVLLAYLIAAFITMGWTMALVRSVSSGEAPWGDALDTARPGSSLSLPAL